MCEKNSACKIIGSFLQVVLIAFSVLIWIFSSKIYYDGEISSVIAKDLKDNFYSVPISDFRQENLDYIEEEDEYPLRNLKESLGINYVNFGIWQGTVKGCGKKSDDGSYTVKALDSDKSCTDDEVFLESIEPVDLGIYSGMKVSKRTIGKTYFQLLNEEGSIISENQNCADDKKSCGYIDTLKNKLCINKNKNCPINYIKIDYDEPKDVNITKTIYGKNKNMYLSNNPYSEEDDRTPYIIGNFKIADKQICSIPNLYWSNYELYNLDANIHKYATQCSLEGYKQNNAFDNELRYHRLDEISIYDLYKENGIIDLINRTELINYGFDFNKYFRNDKKLYLYVRTFYGFNKTCLKDREIEFNVNQLDELETKHSISEKMKNWGFWAKGLMVASEISSLIAFPDLFTNSGHFNPQFFIGYILSIIGNIGNLWQTTHSNSYDDAYQDPFLCSDSVTNEIYNIMAYKINESGKNIRITN